MTEVVAAGPFWEAQEEDQDYLQKHPEGETCHFARPGWKLPRRPFGAADDATTGSQESLAGRPVDPVPGPDGTWTSATTRPVRSALSPPAS